MKNLLPPRDQAGPPRKKSSIYLSVLFYLKYPRNKFIKMQSKAKDADAYLKEVPEDSQE
jgi:hypothetical protein